uniref:Leucine rich immune protein (Coil-less) n=1 Tax=Anopheles culicifacies TaxID=139723 RepID=A0A182MNF1_9DIPT
MQHVPVTNNLLKVVDFRSATIDTRFFDQVHPFSSVEISSSESVKRMTLPENSTIASLTLERTRLVWAHFEENFYLQQLHIIDSPLKAPSPSLRNLKHLKGLTLRKTGIASINLSCINLHDFALFTKLLDFDVAFNKIDSITGRLINVALSRLGLAGNRLKSIDFCHWNELRNVSEISLALNSLGRIPNCLYKFPRVVMVYLQANQITHVNMDELVMLKSLQVLNLASNRIYATTVHAESFPPKLVQLFLYDNCICKMVVPDEQLMPYTNLTIYLHKMYGNVLNIMDIHCKTC